MLLARTSTLAKLGFLLALSLLGSYIKLGPTSIAFDAMSGFVAALLMGPAAGALICGLGHAAAAAVTGFPLTLPFHAATAAAMAGVGALGGLTARRFGALPAAAALVAANGLLAPALLSLLPNPLGVGLFAALWLPLTAATGANAAAALVVVLGLRRAGFGS
ncbi:putative membrane protein [Symbiobacterium terraclitae]|uniref:Membrane protein n=1 Tax=Symbiobacterium terraclitae TaxID=557451 RepID=A0ABS4JU27_9FIRM|nr:putative membrane protein [Symbiobacterium terraclitae]